MNPPLYLLLQQLAHAYLSSVYKALTIMSSSKYVSPLNATCLVKLQCKRRTFPLASAVYFYIAALPLHNSHGEWQADAIARIA